MKCQQNTILRLLNLFLSCDPSAVATGNWGCGAFGGDPQLKSLIQLMAASQNGRDILYFTFGDEKLRDEIYDIFLLLKNRNVNIGRLYNVSTHLPKNYHKIKHIFTF